MELSQRLFDHYSNFTKYKQLFKLNQIIIKSLSTPQTNHILSLLNSGHSAYKLSSTTGVHPSIVSILCSKHYIHPPTSSSGQPSKLSSININYKIYLIISSKVESAVQVTKTLQNIINKHLSTETVYYYLKKAGMEAVIKKMMLHLTKHYKRERLNFEISHKD
jgi:hypothetical protein